MLKPVFLYDTYEAARGALPPERLEYALAVAMRLGRNALPEELQAALLMPLLQQSEQHARPFLDEDVLEIIETVAQRGNEPVTARAERVLESANLSAARLLLAEWYQLEYGVCDEPAAQAKARRAAIRLLCRSLPLEVHCDIRQGQLLPQDADFLAIPDFSTMNASLH